MHEGTKTIATIAVELGSSEFAMLRAARASFPHYGPATSGPETSGRSMGNLREEDFRPASLRVHPAHYFRFAVLNRPMSLNRMSEVRSGVFLDSE